jgi:excisionase family DNA binding protein
MAIYPLFTVEDVATILRVRPATIRKWIKRGNIPAITLPHKDGTPAWRRYRIKNETVERLIQES